MHAGVSIGRLAVLLAVVGTLSAGGAALAADDWQANAGDDWQRLLAAARQEGKVVVAGHPALATSFAKGFERDTGIALEYLSGGPSELYQRLSREAGAGHLTLDVSIGGGAELTMLAAGQLEPRSSRN